MSPAVAFAVLFSALLHASWNAVVRFRADRLATITLLAAFAMLFAAPLAVVVSPPPPQAWPWLAASVVLHVGYNLFLATAYAHGELSKVYPIARGTAPLLTLVISLTIIGEPLAASTAVGVVVLGAGILALAFDQGLIGLRDGGRSVLFAIATSVFIAGYTIADGMGARASGDPHGFTVWLFLLNGIPLLLYALWIRGVEATGLMIAENWRAGLVAGLLSLAAYWIVIWAMTVAPIPLVAALRETSVVFAVIIGAMFLGERFSLARMASTLTVLVGLAILRL